MMRPLFLLLSLAVLVVAVNANLRHNNPSRQVTRGHRFVHKQHLLLEFEAFGFEFTVNTRKLSRKGFFASDHKHVLLKNGEYIEVEEQLDCLFRGQVTQVSSSTGKAVKDSMVILNLCDTFLRGTVVNDDFDYTFTKVDESLNGTFVELVVTRSNVMEALEAFDVEGIERVVEAEREERNLAIFNANTQSKIKYVQVLVVNDFERYITHGKQTHAVSAEVLQYTALLYEKLSSSFSSTYGSAAYEIRISIAGMISMSHGDPWTDTLTMVGSEVDPNSLLSNFNEWRENQLSDRRFPEHSVAHLISGLDFQNSNVGLAYLQLACSKAAATGVNQGKGFDINTVGTIVAHELAHNLGVYHNGATPPTGISLSSSSCSGGIMDPSGIRQSTWTRCTMDYLRVFFEGSANYPRRYGTTTIPACLESPPQYVWGITSECGNGLKEAGEQCDCGADVCQDDPCCDGSTCTLKGEFECSLTDPCCTEECMIYDPAIVGEDRVCRESVDKGCDKEEKCDGQTAECPYDQFVAGGTSCEASDGSTGTCFAGACNSHSNQCAQHSNLGATGPCPFQDDDDGDIACGALSCLFSDGECKGIQQGDSLVQVYDGTRCSDDGDICDGASSKCLSPEEVELPAKITCSNGFQDDGETDVDCGGPQCNACFPGEKCLNHSDCYEGRAGSEYECVNSTYTSASYIEVLRNRTFIRPSGDVRCTDLKDEDSCSVFSGCVWIGEYSSIQINKCKNTGFYPSRTGDFNYDDPLTCQGQQKMQSCINWIYCDWDFEVSECFALSREREDLVYGVCSGPSPFNRTPEEDNWWTTIEEWFMSLYMWIEENQLAAAAIGGCIAIVMLSWCLSCVCDCRRRMYRQRLERKKQRKRERRARRRATRAAAQAQANTSSFQQQSSRPTNKQVPAAAVPQAPVATVVGEFTPAAAFATPVVRTTTSNTSIPQATTVATSYPVVQASYPQVQASTSATASSAQLRTSATTQQTTQPTVSKNRPNVPKTRPGVAPRKVSSGTGPTTTSGSTSKTTGSFVSGQATGGVAGNSSGVVQMGGTNMRSTPTSDSLQSQSSDKPKSKLTYL